MGLSDASKSTIAAEEGTPDQLQALAEGRVPVGMLLLDASAYPEGVPTQSLFVGRSEVRIVYREVEGATVERLVHEGDPQLEERFVNAARELVEAGARAITGDCGFMIRHQDAVRNAVDVPVVLSGLTLAPLVLSCTGAQGKLGIITASKRALTPELLRAAGITDLDRVVTAGLDTAPAFQAAVMDCTETMDRAAVEQETVEVAAALMRDNPDVTTILLECTALPRFAAAVQRRVKVPVLDVIRLIDLFAAAHMPQAGQRLM
ncbi:hypothetical protein [Pedococcus sp. P5_B7]